MAKTTISFEEKINKINSARLMKKHTEILDKVCNIILPKNEKDFKEMLQSEKSTLNFQNFYNFILLINDFIEHAEKFIDNKDFDRPLLEEAIKSYNIIKVQLFDITKLLKGYIEAFIDQEEEMYYNKIMEML